MATATRIIQQPNTYVDTLRQQTNSKADAAEKPGVPPLLIPKADRNSKMTGRMAASRMTGAGQQQSVIKERYHDESDHCQICRLKGKRKLAAFSCTTCNMPLCYACGDQHKETEVTATHDVIPRKHQDGSVATCNIHKFAAVQFWCETCSQLICVNCTMIDHKNHEISDIPTKMDECREMLMVAVKELDTKIVGCDRQLKKVSDIEAGIQQNRELIRRNMTAMVSDLKRKLDMQHDALAHQLDKYMDARLGHLNKTKDMLQKRFDEMMAVRLASETSALAVNSEKYVTDVEKLLRQSSEVKDAHPVDEREYTGLKFTLTNNEELGVMEETGKPVLVFQGNRLKNTDKIERMLQPANVQKAEVVKRLTEQNREWFTVRILNKFKTISYVQKPSGIAILPGGKFVIADASSSGLLLCDEAGRFQQRILIGDVMYPGGVAITKQGNIAVTTDKYIKIFKPGGYKVGQISAPPTPDALQIDQNGNFIVSDAKSRHVTIFSPEGQVMHRFYTTDKLGNSPDPYNIAVSGSQIALSYQHYLNFYVKLFSYEGHLLNSVKLPEACGGIQMDRFGNMVVASGELCYVPGRGDRAIPLTAYDRKGVSSKLMSHCVAFTSSGEMCTLHVNTISKRSEFVLLQLGTTGLDERKFATSFNSVTARTEVNWSNKSPLPHVTPRPPSI